MITGTKASTTTRELRNTISYKSQIARKEEGAPAKREFRKGNKICLERARLMTQSYKETEGEPEVIRRAKALAKVLENMTIYIRSGERIVGNYASDPYSFPLYPEISFRALEHEINDGLRYMLDDKGKEELQDIISYWSGKSIEDRVMAVVPDSLKDYIDFNGLTRAHFMWGKSGLLPNFKTLFELGLNGIIKKADVRLEELKADVGGLRADEFIEQSHFLKAAIIACRGAINFSRRFADKAREMAEVEGNATRKRMLEEIAEICDRVPANSARTLHEAMQSLWFAYLINHMIETTGQACGIRLDYLVYPFYKKDMEEGRISREDAQQLVEFLYIKIEEMGQLLATDVGQAGATLFQTINLGGTTPEGEDATNEFSFIMLDAAMAMRTINLDLAIRCHPKIDQNLILKAIDLIYSGLGYPKFFNDNAIIPFLVERGIPLKEARNYVVSGCVAWLMPGKSANVGRPNVGVVNFGKCLELALNQGKDVFTGRQLGWLTPDPTSFTSIDAVMDAYLKQLGYAAKKLVDFDNLVQGFCARYMQRPFSSAVVDDCIENGKDCTSFVYDPITYLLCCGNTNVADSIAAMKKLVFEEKLITMDELLAALRNNFEGQEELRQQLLKAPKFGNDDDYVDLIMREVQHKSQEEVQKLSDYYGYPVMLDGSIAGAYYPWGRRCGATPDGRKAKETFADAVLSPMAGMDSRGPTAVIKSTGKVTPTWCYLTNQKFMPQYLEGENKKLFLDYLKTWADLGNYHIQFNVVDKKTLLDAQEHPENYSDLIVRVAGYSAYFVELSRGLQNDIIARATQSL